MEAQLYSVSKIFTERILRIPDYQRGYAWTAKQLKDFWNDLLQLPEGKNHYTGVLTLEAVPESTYSSWADDLWIIKYTGYTPYYVVDGQQRLTTTIILIQAITECVSEHSKLNYTSIDDIKKKYIFTSKDEGISRSYIFGYEKDNPSYEFLKRRIFLEKSDASDGLQETIYTHNLEYAKQYFVNLIQHLPIEEIEFLFRKLTQNFLFNIYSISEDIDVYVAFETMNNRGKPLSHLELLKNRLIYLSTKFNADLHERQKLRNAINESWKAVYHYLGKNKENPLDDDIFLQNHFEFYFGNSERHLYRDNPYFKQGKYSAYYQEYLLEQVFTTKSLSTTEPNKKLMLKDVYTYVSSLKESVEIWYQLLNPRESDFSKEEKLWLEKLNRLNIFGVAPIIMVFYQREHNPKLRARLLRILERYLFLQSLYQLTRYSGFYYAVHPTQQFYKELRDADVPTEKYLKDLEQFVDGFASEQIFKALLVDTKNINFYNWRGIRYFLFEYELELQERSKSYRSKLDWDVLNSDLPVEDDRDFYTVEHIYPQKPRKDCWLAKFDQYTDRERATLKNSLGNLVPLSQPKNSSLKNKCFEEKKGNKLIQVGFKYGSYSENEVANYDDWGAMHILERGIRMLEFLETRWKLKLGDEASKIRLLNLGFVLEKEK
jgi:hypothetical protein